MNMTMIDNKMNNTFEDTEYTSNTYGAGGEALRRRSSVDANSCPRSIAQLGISVLFPIIPSRPLLRIRGPDRCSRSKIL
jgi:hypothetical protein